MTEPQSVERAITHDAAYEAVAPDDFAAMVAVDRYGSRCDAFDAIIGATHDHFWDPHNPAYLDYAQPFDIERESIMPLDRFPELNCAATAHLDERQETVREGRPAAGPFSGALGATGRRLLGSAVGKRASKAVLSSTLGVKAGAWSREGSVAAG